MTDPVNGNYSAGYLYDAVGNRTQSIIDGVITSYSYDSNDRLLSAGGTTYTYDNNGNTLTKTENGQTVTYGYDSRDRLISITDGQNAAIYEYNVDGIRTGKVENGETIRYLVDQNRDYAQVVTEVTNGAVGVQYLYGDDLIHQDRAGNLSYYLYDGLGSTRALSDGTGSLTDSYHYDAFGVESVRAGNTPNNYLFTGEQFDSTINQLYLRNRYYNQQVGRFAQMDMFAGIMREPVTLNKYLYANADPVNGIDPTGRYTQQFGYLVEKEVEKQYLASHACGFCQFGVRQYYNPLRFLKPDIMNWDQHTLNEIKPLSPSGIGKGVAQIKVYKTVYGLPPYNFIADMVWTPSPAVVGDSPTYFVNIGGIIFYTDDRELRQEVSVATLGTVAFIARHAARRVLTNLGADAVLQAAVSNGVRANVAANRARLQGLTFGAGFGFGLL